MALETLVLLLVLVLALGVPFLWLLARANELFLMQVRGGKVEVIRGRVPPALLRDVRDVLRDVKHADVHARLENGLPMVRAEGLHEGQLQRVRNIVGRFSKVQMKPGR